MYNQRILSNILIFGLIYASVVSANSINIESIGTNIGYSYINYNEEGNIKEINRPSQDFLNLELYLTIGNLFDDKTLVPSIHYLYNRNSDIDIHTLLFGLNKCFAFENFNLYTGIVAGYGTLLWKDNPIKYTTTNDFSSNSLVGGLQFGSEFPITEQLKFNLNLKYLLHDYKIDLKPLPNYSSALSHPTTASISLGFRWFFSKSEEIQKTETEIIIKENIETVTKVEIIESPKSVAPGNDSDGDGVINLFDRCENTPQGFLVDSVGCKKIYTLNIKFSYKSNYIRQKYIQEIQKLAREINKSRDYDVIIKSHTDSIGSNQYNLNLSKSRADAVYEKLVRYGVNKRRITIKNMGESSPIASNMSERGREINRRIEITLIKKTQ